MQTDLTLFTNEPGSTLLDRFKKTLKDVQFFDVLEPPVGTLLSLYLLTWVLQ
jgi:hypothetical protein